MQQVSSGIQRIVNNLNNTSHFLMQALAETINTEQSTGKYSGKFTQGIAQRDQTMTVGKVSAYVCPDEVMINGRCDDG